ncbi:DUF2345 domain-containing protein, partial [Franconibacter helveticus]|uniref:DUF2345 domain-containing protein n=1 Tax=Franconibacter helveticus TaxID=357240 RepID=UPI000A7CC8B4
IFISADGQPKAQGQVREMAPAVSLLNGAKEQMQGISTDAQTATAEPADLQAQISLLQQSLTELKQAVVLMSAPQGISIASGEHLQLSASQNLISTAGKNADISVVKDFFIGVGNTLSIFVRRLGMKLIANQGAVQVQAQNDLMELVARKGISIVSTEDEISIIAKKKITLNGGGSYITLDGNAIESATLGDFRTKAGYYDRQQKANLKMALAALPGEITGMENLVLNFFDQGNQPISGAVYTVTFDGGKVLQGQLDEKGYALHTNVPEEGANVVYQLPEPLSDTPWPPYSKLTQATSSSFIG